MEDNRYMRVATNSELNPRGKISVITPSLNSGKTIEKAIKSVIMQDYSNFEHFVVDGVQQIMFLKYQRYTRRIYL
jgi:hypothetical protein